MSNAHTTATTAATHAVAKGHSDYYAGQIIDPDDIKPRAGHSGTLLAGTYRLITR